MTLVRDRLQANGAGPLPKQRTPAETQAALWAEWERANPRTPEAIARFYRESQEQGADLDNWHQLPERQTWTTALRYVATQINARRILDIGCGQGHDLLALREDDPSRELIGVEPNERSREKVDRLDFLVVPSVDDVDLDEFDLVTCFDVLEHVPDPETFLAGVVSQMRLGSVFVETTTTTDIGTPLHLEANQGWHPGRCLERHGFVLLDRKERFAVWQRAYQTAPQRQSLLICAYRAMSIPTLTSVMNLAGISGHEIGEDNQVRITRMATSTWRIGTKYADGLIDRSRSIIVSRWWAETADDVFLMLDDDVVFEPGDAERLVALCREKRGIVCAAYPVGDGSHLATRQFQGDTIEFRPDAEPMEIEYAATGFMAVHRDVIDALVPTLPLCHANEPWCFWPFFRPMLKDLGACTIELSEDWAFCERAGAAGFTIWLDPSIRLGHLKLIEISVGNMETVHQAITMGRKGIPDATA